MKKTIVVVLGLGVLVGFGMYVSRPKAESAPAPEPAAAVIPSRGDKPLPLIESATERAETVQVIQTTNIPKQAERPAPTSTATNPQLEATFVQRAVDLLVSPQTSHQQKRDTWKQLRDSGKLDQAIAELQQRTMNDSVSPEYPSALGQAYLQKCAVIQDVRDRGILAMQADKMFDTALALDPSNWEARFTKAVAMSYWPPVLNKGDEVIQHFQTLVEQQESQTPQPQFAETYAWLGDQYQKAGRTDDARTVWQRGAALFPANDKLREKLATAQ